MVEPQINIRDTWRHFLLSIRIFGVFQSGPKHLFLTMPDGSTSNSTSLSVHSLLPCPQCLYSAAQIPKAFPDLPLLRTAIFDKCPVGVVFPWAQLTSFTIKRIYARLCAPLLQQASNLVHSKLGIEGYSDDDEAKEAEDDYI